MAHNENDAGQDWAPQDCAPQDCAPQDCAPQDCAPQDCAPDACTLPTAQRPLRAAAFTGLFTEALRGLERVGPTRLRLDLRPGRQVAGRTAELAAAETECCSFFTFALTVTGGGLVLDVTVPPSRAGVLDGLAQQATAGLRR